MPLIQLTTVINAPIERCFDLARSITFHEATTSETNEKAVAGVTKGLISKGEQVTWRAKHFGVYQHLTSFISEMNAPYFFEDRMLKGAFKSICHKHHFEEKDGLTIMKDEFEYEVPLGLAGKLVARTILTPYLKGFLVARNKMLKDALESDEWKKYL